MKNLLYLFLSVLFTSGRNIASKKTATHTNKLPQFFLSQTILFVSATLLLLVFGVKDLTSIAYITLIYGIIYGVLLVMSQWMLSLALKIGNTSICSVVYSLGFILPTVSGTLFWEEDLTFLNGVGIMVAIGIILLSAKKDFLEKQNSNKAFIVYLLIAMLSSGGLGIMQKVQQFSKNANQKVSFLLIAFCFAFFCSFIAFLLCREKAYFTVKNTFTPAFTGLCFGGANLCNTILAGRMKSAVFFPLQNISTILLTSVLGIVILKERLTVKTSIILFLGIIVIILFSI